MQLCMLICDTTMIFQVQEGSFQLWRWAKLSDFAGNLQWLHKGWNSEAVTGDMSSRRATWPQQGGQSHQESQKCGQAADDALYLWLWYLYVVFPSPMPMNQAAAPRLWEVVWWFQKISLCIFWVQLSREMNTADDLVSMMAEGKL